MRSDPGVYAGSRDGVASRAVADTFFTIAEDGDWFQPTEHTRGPRDPTACHAGPPTAMMARALERAVPDKRLARITVDLIRPVPLDAF